MADDAGCFDYFHVVAASNYFAEPAASPIATKVGSFDGRTRRAALKGGVFAMKLLGSDGRDSRAIDGLHR